MQNIEEIKQQCFMESKKLISELLYVENPEELVDNKFKMDHLLELTSFLKQLDIRYIPQSQIEELPTSILVRSEQEQIDQEEEIALDIEEPTLELNSSEEIEDRDFEKNKGEEETYVDKNVDSEVIAVDQELEEINNLEELSGVDDKEKEEQIPQSAIADDANSDTPPIIEERPSEFDPINLDTWELDSESFREKNPEETQATVASLFDQDLNAEKEESKSNEENVQQYKESKKIKLAHIKGLKAVQSLFEDLPQEEDSLNEEGSKLSEQVPTDTSIAGDPISSLSQQRQVFKLDLNDRIAFTKILFNGSQSDLNHAVAQLNQYQTIDQAKEYLSDLYYERNWEKVDDYAQRLWSLVENKFQ